MKWWKFFLRKKSFFKMESKDTPIIRVTTYNVLANSMATPDFFQLDNPEHLQLEVRLPKLLSKLECFIKSYDIIALQEVDIALACGGINTLFLEHHYEVLRAHYSTMPERDAFGNFLCIPIKKYKILHYGQERIGSFITMPQNVGKMVLPNKKVNNNVYEEAQKRDSTMLYALLQDIKTNTIFYVFTYHMPCAFWWIPVMTLHIDALKSRIDVIAKNNRFILLGDFNEVPGTDLFNFLMDTSQFSKSLAPCSLWAPSTNMLLKDAKLTRNILPTNRARNKNGTLFQGCLDHIFYSQMIPLEYVVETIQFDEELPNAENPSDHVPVSCVFTI